ncbi:DNA repair exonuclease SbcCD nuclease subunit [Hathewaya proteolytica DSM 3090]|uniref:DNA repair exonuclease SbcCD nuclease subunit n=1 Tax=Hathewaya proteolytica DSM 3090 TaxID=1121331 RepID=A0A1M6KI96_9CLOT|nr:metallophosphoesterase [Hathewaya proteolytica]SHJ58620.1 DNA repair exonuclease SbcCD nuclease subunit [Hathewaya proteolytica DSM 3090]
MKIIHCADLHLDSKMETNLNVEKARERRIELLNTFKRMVEYAKKNSVRAIIIAGDLFDKKNITLSAKNMVIDQIRENSQVDFYYLTGNHEMNGFISNISEIPNNLKLFEKEWKSYNLTENNKRPIVITGVELSGDNESDIYSTLELDYEAFNVVVLHGQISEYTAREGGEIIDLSRLKNKNIDYLALGHVHEYQEGELPPRGEYCYAGCLEGRGFDECGEHGFVELDIDEVTHIYKKKFVSFAYRNLYCIFVDVTGCNTTSDMERCINKELEMSCCQPRDLVKIVLEGKVDVECEKDIEALVQLFSSSFYKIKIYDHTKLAINYQNYLLDASLKGEFVRAVQNETSLDEQERAEIIRCGIQALEGEEIEI